MWTNAEEVVGNGAFGPRASADPSLHFPKNFFCTWASPERGGRLGALSVSAAPAHMGRRPHRAEARFAMRKE